MTDPLPHRTFTELPAPPGGIATAVRDGRRIRSRRRTAGAGAAALSLAVVAGAVIVAGGSGPSATDELVPADVPSASPSAAGPAPVTSAPATVTRPEPAVPGAAPVRSPGAPVPTLLPRRPSPSPSPARVVAADPGGYRTPDLVRTYRLPASPSAAGPGAQICGTRTATGNDIGSSTGFCLAAAAPASRRGHDLTLEVCRDDTGPGRLFFPRELEVDLVVRNPSGRVLWQWAAGRSDDADPHSLDVPSRGCWTWTAPWTDVDRSGRALSPGQYEVVAVSRANELRSLETKASFTVE